MATQQPVLEWIGLKSMTVAVLLPNRLARQRMCYQTRAIPYRMPTQLLARARSTCSRCALSAH
ncbi:hypothetical protein AQ611_16875 [Burkholderia singularis]|nr:hypothetical protein AQ611_16875 [Burkholderia sp. Bp7605]